MRTSCPSARSRRARWRPRKPAPPVIAHRIAAGLYGESRPRHELGPLVAGRFVALGAAVLAGLTLAAAAHAGNPQIAGLQVALRAYGLYNGPIDAIAGPQTVRATKAFQRRAGLVADGRAGPADAPRARAARDARLRPAHAAPRALRLGRLGAAVHARAPGPARPGLRLLRPRHRARAAALSALAPARRRRHRRAGHDLRRSATAAPACGRPAPPPRLRSRERAHDAHQLGDRVPARPGARPRRSRGWSRASSRGSSPRPAREA